MTTTSETRGAGRVTIREVAAAASVNASTVSRVLNPETPHLIGDEVVRRVLATAKALGYRQNGLAAALRTTLPPELMVRGSTAAPRAASRKSAATGVD
jgi:LacI family transcriptional regulator